MDNAKKQRKATVRKTRDLFKKTGDSKGTCHVRMGMTKDRNKRD